MQQCVSALVRRREMGAFKSSPSNARLPTWEVLTVVFWRKAPITWPAIPHQKLITTNKQTNTERGLELKTKKSSCIFSNFYLSFPHNIRVHTSDRIPTLSVNHGLFADWYTRWGDFGLESFFFPSVISLHVDFQSGQCCWCTHASFSVAGVLLVVTRESGLRVIRSSSAWTSVKPGFCPWKKKGRQKQGVISCSFCVVFQNNTGWLWENRFRWVSVACWYAFKSSMLCGYTNADKLRTRIEKTNCMLFFIRVECRCWSHNSRPSTHTCVNILALYVNG